MNTTEAREWISSQDIAGHLAWLQRDGTELEANRALRVLLEDLLTGGTVARHALPDINRVCALRSDFPHFAQVVDLYEGEVSLACTPGAVPHAFPPVLLLGEPGVGKTSFALALAEALSAPFRCHAMSAATSGFSLGGLDRGWSNGRPGAVFDVLRRTGVLNPVFLLDEIDKVSDEPRFSPLGPFYQLLEPATARQFTDEFVGLPLDASQVTWIATANDLGAVPPALRSRLSVFNIPTPGADGMSAIVARMFRHLCEQIPSMHPQLPQEVVAQLAGRTPRDAQRHLRDIARRASIRASHAGRSTISISRIDMRADRNEKPPRRMGFV